MQKNLYLGNETNLVEIMQPVSGPLSNLQLELLKVFSRNVPAEDLLAIKELIATYFAQKAMDVADEIWDEEGFTENTMTQWRRSHLRTSYPKSQADDTQKTS